MRLFILILLCISALSTSVTPDPKNDEINVKQVFPALANQNVGNIYSGYMQVASSRILHYWYAQVRSPLQQANVPLIAWFNGGPGCSSLDGAFYENGPFYFQSESFNTTPIYNPYSWNSIANVPYIEMPAGVGFSVKTDQLPQDDYTVAQDVMAGIKQFLTAFDMWSNELYIMGESYAGVYVPYLSHAINADNAIKKANKQTTINLQGFSTGNGCTSPLAGECGFMASPFVSPLGSSQGLFLYEQGFLSQDQFITFYELCYLPETQDEQQCYNYVDQISNQVGINYGGNAPYVNYYDIYRFCSLAITNQTANNQRVVNKKDLTYQRINKARKNLDWKKFCKSAEECESLDIAVAGDTINPGAPCIDTTAATIFFNNKTIWPLIGINPQYYDNSTFQWSLCVQSADQMDFTASVNGSYWIYWELLQLKKYKVMIYSGNTDLCVPIAGTRQWIDQLRRELNIGLIQSMSNWYYYPPAPSNDPNASMPETVAGTYEQYDNNFRFVTVNGVGHQVPAWNRKASLQMVESYINWQPLPGFGQAPQN
eukprot:TRINITY_DN48_c0_g1_i4.p1 TRINITY_DN48_c0_g1~~TRINITY_DN48_c0_g1_i4.p1  ORF type:complete len:541 (-),score=55.41 TRINITY_DN48_c0_g1_i4:181-1803(-)